MGTDGTGAIWIEEKDFGDPALEATAPAGLSMDDSVQRSSERNPNMLISIEDHCPRDDVETNETWEV
jgi:hypothetical protein